MDPQTQGWFIGMGLAADDQGVTEVPAVVVGKQADKGPYSRLSLPE